MKRKKSTSIIAIILVIVLLLGLVAGAIVSLATGALAVSQSEIDDLKSQRADIQTKQKDLANKIADMKSQQASYLDQKAALDEQNALTQEEIDNISQQIALYDALLAAKQKDLDAAQANEQAQAERYKTRVRAMEENGTVSYLSILFKATSFADLLSRIDSIQEVMKADQQLEANYIAAVNNVAAVKADYEASQADAEAQKSDLSAKKAQLESDIAAATAFINNLQDNIDTANAATAQNQQAEDDLTKQINNKMAELAAQEAAAKKAAEEAAKKGAGNGNSGVVVGTGTLAWPLPSSHYVSSGFGMRVHPIFGDLRMHTGWDVGGGQGEPIVAADDGTVAIAVYSSSYGNYTVISHGNGYSTLYAHQSKIAVNVGDHVTKGETIGYVGATGWATGPHLHFEVRLNGNPIDPAPFYPGQYTKGPNF
ncbi:MAG: peptidoglycan DD-metalloendopeptidase family protein [Firmicutes bacterium]|nr:peptidoglycan DD-metalloendopeptidase family protein [Bacillota bacterium]